MVLTRSVNIEQAYREIDVRIVVMIAGVIPLGAAMQETGTAGMLASQLLSISGDRPILVILLAMFTVAALVTQILSDAATVVLLGPIAVAVAPVPHLAPEPFVVCVAFGAVASLSNADRAPRQPADSRSRSLHVRRFPASRRAPDRIDRFPDVLDGAGHLAQRTVATAERIGIYSYSRHALTKKPSTCVEGFRHS